jgi:quercetin dioxygenase-like cupin family protein
VRSSWTSPPVVVVVALAAVACALFATSARTAPPHATRVDLASGPPALAPGYQLSLKRATIPAKAAFPPHRHPGMQVAYVQAGTIRYTVYRGEVHVYRGNADGSQKVVRTISHDQTASIHAGEWIVETPSLWHAAANPGTTQAVILVSSLLRANQPGTIPVKP